MANKRSRCDLENEETRQVIARKIDDKDAVLERSLYDFTDDVILKIMSFIPTKEVFGTCNLSKRWNDLVPSVYDIDLRGPFQKNKAARMSFMKFVVQYLSRRKNIRVDRFRLSCTDSCMIPKWIRFCIVYAMAHDVREFDLSIKTTIIHVLPYEVFTCKKLVTLRLSMLPNFILRLPTNCCLPNLKVLRLHRLTLGDKEFFGRLLSSCDSLEELAVESCEFKYMHKLCVCNPKLKWLTIIGAARMRSYSEIEINTPNLIYLNYDYIAATEESYINLNSLSKTHIDIGLNISSVCRKATTPGIDLMRAISHVRSLRLTGCVTPLQNILLKSDLLPKFPNLTYLKMGGCYPGWGYLLANCPYLETLDFDFWGCGPTDWHTTNDVPSCLVHHIKAINLISFEGKQVQFKLVEYLLENGKVLESLTVKLEIFEPESEKRRVQTEMSAKIFALPKVSKECNIRTIAKTH